MIHDLQNSEQTATEQTADAMSTTATLLSNPNTLILNDILTDKDIPWQIYNCKIVEKTVTQDQPLPFIYHYDALPEEVKKLHPLTGELLKQFQTPMSAKQAAQLLAIDEALIDTPWMVKITGTLVMFCERLQIALRLKFTNTAKEYDPIYTKTEESAVQTTMQDWHFYGDIFVLNKGSKPLLLTLDQQWIEIPQLAEYQVLPAEYALATLAILEENKSSFTELEDAIKQRLI